MERQLLTGGVLLDPEAAAPRPGSLLVAGERIEAVLGPQEAPPADARPVELGGAGVAPGFLDLHYHGGLVFARDEDFESALRADCVRLVRTGTTAFLATTVAWPSQRLADRVGRLAGLLPELQRAGARPLGLHLEGPWIEPRAAGAQPGAAIRPIEMEEVRQVLSRGAGSVRMVTLAPELAGAEELCRALARSDVVPALGHSQADAASVERAVGEGARHVTHLFNAMAPLHHRSPGLVGAALADDRLSCDLIADGAHVAPSVVKLAWRAKGEGLSLISDALAPDAAGTGFGSGQLCDDGVALRLPDGTLAGSCLGLDRALRNLRAWTGAPLLEAVAACTLRPARLLGVEARHGTLRPGARADLVLLGDDGTLRATWIGGRPA